MSNIKILGAVKIPSKMSEWSKYKMLKLQQEIDDYIEVVQELTDFPSNDSLLVGNGIFTPEIMCFREVEEHTDGVRTVRYNKRSYSVGFIHVVMKGSFTLKYARKKYNFKEGDVFMMNPRVIHSVHTEQTCMTLLFEVAMKPFLEANQENPRFLSSFQTYLENCSILQSS